MANATGRAAHAYLHMPARTTAAEVLARTRYVWGDVEAIDEQTCEYRTSDDSLDLGFDGCLARAQPALPP